MIPLTSRGHGQRRKNSRYTKLDIYSTAHDRRSMRVAEEQLECR